jgi:hypothetical protein
MCWNDFIERNVSSYTIWLCISTSNIVKPRKGINYFPLLANFQNKQFMSFNQGFCISSGQNNKVPQTG